MLVALLRLKNELHKRFTSTITFTFEVSDQHIILYILFILNVLVVHFVLYIKSGFVVLKEFIIVLFALKKKRLMRQEDDVYGEWSVPITFKVLLQTSVLLVLAAERFHCVERCMGSLTLKGCSHIHS